MLLGDNALWFSCPPTVSIQTNIPPYSLNHPLNQWMSDQKDYNKICERLSQRTDVSHICHYLRHMYEMKYDAQPKYDVLKYYFIDRVFSKT